MAKVMIRCPTTGKEFDTALEVPRMSGLKSIGLKMAECPHCHQRHYLRLPYFEGDEPADPYTPADGLETAPAFAAEVGIIIAGTAFMEVYIPQVFSRASGESGGHVHVIFGAIASTSQKIGVLEVLRDLTEEKESRSDLAIMIEKFRRCSTVRDKYAHAKYHYSGGDSITVFPYFADTRKRKDTISVSIGEIREDAEFLRRTKYMIREYVMKGTRPKR